MTSYLIFGALCVAVYVWRKPIWAFAKDSVSALYTDDNEPQ